MPLYEFVCGCGMKFERIRPRGTDSDTCPKCQKAASRKVVSKFQSSLSGPGFHASDYPTFDRAVGRDADRKWALREGRKAEKKRLQEANPDKEVVVNTKSHTYEVVGS